MKTDIINWWQNISLARGSITILQMQFKRWIIMYLLAMVTKKWILMESRLIWRRLILIFRCLTWIYSLNRSDNRFRGKTTLVYPMKLCSHFIPIINILDQDIAILMKYRYHNRLLFTTLTNKSKIIDKLRKKNRIETWCFCPRRLVALVIEIQIYLWWVVAIWNKKYWRTHLSRQESFNFLIKFNTIF